MKTLMKFGFVSLIVGMILTPIAYFSISSTMIVHETIPIDPGEGIWLGPYEVD